MPRRRKGTPLHGWLVIDKAKGETSTGVVTAVRRVTGAAKVGHGGTLDPLATGILPIALGEATKTVSFAMDGRKAYDFTVRWGVGTATDDAEGDVTATSDVRPDAEEIDAVLSDFIGEITQVPPAFSAIKVQGERAYDLARDGQPPALPPRTVEVHDLILAGSPDSDHARFRCLCGKGTYIRALARDIGKVLGTVAHVTDLRRTCVGAFSLDDAVGLDDLRAFADRAGSDRPNWEEMFLPVDAPLDGIPAVVLSDVEVARLRQGQALGLLKRSDKSRLEALRGHAEDDRSPLLVLARGPTGPVGFAHLVGAELRPHRLLNLA